MTKIYLDTNSWIRPFENGNQTVQSEGNAVNDIINICCDKYEIVSSAFQYKQMEALKRNTTSEDAKNTFEMAYSILRTMTKESKHDPYCKNETDTIFSKSQLGQSEYEDAIHITLAWRQGCDYFITADEELYRTRKHVLESEVEQLWHPIETSHTKRIKIVNPITFMAECLKSL